MQMHWRKRFGQPMEWKTAKVECVNDHHAPSRLANPDLLDS